MTHTMARNKSALDNALAPGVSNSNIMVLIMQKCGNTREIKNWFSCLSDMDIA